ncbi:hypothetical protein FB451DRAFT_1164918 [Mycena latifolia]|nr:hypothetical protein FB451DRAFT_1164918 [Mycena latifolia]
MLTIETGSQIQIWAHADHNHVPFEHQWGIFSDVACVKGWFLWNLLADLSTAGSFLGGFVMVFEHCWLDSKWICDGTCSEHAQEPCHLIKNACKQIHAQAVPVEPVNCAKSWLSLNSLIDLSTAGLFVGGFVMVPANMFLRHKAAIQKKCLVW